MYTRCATPACAAARTRLCALISSPEALPAQCTIVLAPSTAFAIPSPVIRSPVMNSIPSALACSCRLSTRTAHPASRSRATTSRPSVPVPPVTRTGAVTARNLLACLPVHRLAEQVGMAIVPRVLLDHVDQDPTQAGCTAVGPGTLG